MRFLLDENIPRFVTRFLESERNYVDYVPKAAKNSSVAQLAKEKKAILVTRDSDFANTLIPSRGILWYSCTSFAGPDGRITAKISL
ncbi:MAG: DUF5615 family PIN-like protein [Theionarchaea archaeon]|nr:DUF5615 family PIN-like protein [Theionarchaea archaeon]